MSSKKKSSSSEQKENTNNAPLSPYERILACRSNPPGPPEYLVKLREKSYHDSKWISGEDLQKNPQSSAMLTRFIKNKLDYPVDRPYYDPQYDIIDRIICKKDRKDKKYFVKWMGLGYDQATWEEKVTSKALDDFNSRQHQIHPLKSGDINKLPTIDIKQLDSYIFNSYALESYQVGTMNLLLNNYSKMKNTDIVDSYNSNLSIPCAAFFEYLIQNSLMKDNNNASTTTRTRRSRAQKADEADFLEGENGSDFGPVLIVTPLTSTIKWYNAFRSIKNATTLNYTGPKEGRQKAVETDFNFNDEQLKFHVLVTTPDILDHDKEILSEIKWRIAIFDEANRLKKSDSKLFKVLQHFVIGVQITLMQNQPNYSALKKLTDLLIESCTKQYIDEDTKKAAQTVRSQIQPKVLKKKNSSYDEERELFKVCYIDCPLSNTQRKILKQTFKESAKYVQKNNFIPLCQKVLRLCQHPYLLYSQEYKSEGVDFIQSSTKLLALQELLNEKYDGENRILIMSDFSLMLDMIEDIANMNNKKNERIISQSKEVQHEDTLVFLYNPKYCTMSPSLFKTMNTIIIFDGDGSEIGDMLITNKPPNLHEIYKFHCRDCSEETLSQMCILNNVHLDEIQPRKFESICKLAALAAYSDKEVPDPKSIISSPTVIMNSFNPNEVLEKEFENCDFWSYLVDEEESSKSQAKEDGGEEADENTLVNNNEDDSDDYEWTSRDRDQLLRGLCRFGFNRWKDMRVQTGLKRISNKNVINASRALVREMIRIIGSGSGHAVSRDFIKESSMREEDESKDKEFINSSCFNNEDFKSKLTSNNVVTYLREIENIRFLGDSVKGKSDIYEINPPHPSGQLPKWWKDDYDRYLIYGTWKYGLGCYDQFVEDSNQDILKIFGPSDEPILQKDLTDRAMKIADAIKRKQSVGQRNESSEKSQNKKDNAAYQPPGGSNQNYQSDSEFSSSPTSTTTTNAINTRRRSEPSHSFDDSNYGSEPRPKSSHGSYTSEIYQFLIRWGVPEDDKGNPDYEKFAEDSGLIRYLSVDDVRGLVEDYLEKCKIPVEEGGNAPGTSSKIMQRCNAMKQLREIMRDDEIAHKVFKRVQHWRYIPKEFSPIHEYYYFKEVLNLGLVKDTYKNILKRSEFDDIFKETQPPNFMFDISKVMKRIDVVYSSMMEGFKTNALSKSNLVRSQQPLTTTKKSSSQQQPNAKQNTAQKVVPTVKKSRAKVPIPNGYTLQSNRTLFPADRAIFDGRVVYPLNLGDGKIILNLGNIIPEREDFQSDRYIYPIGYKVSNILPSAKESGTQAQWINEITAFSEENPDAPVNTLNLVEPSSCKLLFKSWMANDPNEVYTGQTANNVWAQICAKIGEVNEGNKPVISGIDAFLLSNQTVTYLIQHMKGFKRCHLYKLKKVDLPPSAQKMKDWSQNSGVPFGQAALNEPNIEAAKSKPPKRKPKVAKNEADDDEFKDVDEEEEEEEEAPDEEEEEEEDFADEEEEKKTNNKLKQQQKQKQQKPSVFTTPPTITKASLPQQVPTAPIAVSTAPILPQNTKKATKKNKALNPPQLQLQQSAQQQQQQQIPLNPAQIQSGIINSNPIIQKVTPPFQIPQQGNMMQGFMPYNKPGIIPNNPMQGNLMNTNLMQGKLMNTQQAQNLPQNFFLQNNVQNPQLVQNNLPKGFLQNTGFIPNQQMQNFIQQANVMQTNNLVQQTPQQNDQNQQQTKNTESNFNDSNPVSNQ